jgi:hypothetical protein
MLLGARLQRPAAPPGYHTEITVLPVPVACASMKNRDIDVFPGNWMPPWSGRLCDEFASVEPISERTKRA